VRTQGHRVESLDDLIKVLSADSEDEHLEFKEAKSSFSHHKLLDYCVALANEGGGQIIFGVTDRVPRRVVGSQAFDNINALKKQVYDVLHFRIDIEELTHPEGRVLVVSVPGRGRGSPVHLEGRYLARVGESLVPMSPDQLRRIFEETASLPQSEQVGYLCGSRIKRVREDLNLKPSHLIDLISFPSETAWRQAEMGRTGVHGQHLASLSELTGASLDWLKHGDGSPYETLPIDDYRWREGLVTLKGIDPFEARVAIDPRLMRCAVLRRRSEYRTDALTFTFDLGFWDWVEDHGHIPEIWRCLRWLRDQCDLRCGVILEPAAAERLFAGNAHAGQFFEGRRSDWFDDLFDLDRKIPHLRREYKAYGAWFEKLQQSIKRWGISGGLS
jgi:hypothetical protein